MNNFKVAIVSNDKKHIVGSFGSAKYFNVITVENGKITDQEIRETYLHQAENELPNILSANEEEGKKTFSLNIVDKSKEKHTKITKTVSDCQVVLARAMCENAKDSINRFNMKFLVTEQKDFTVGIEEILKSDVLAN